MPKEEKEPTDQERMVALDFIKLLTEGSTEPGKTVTLWRAPEDVALINIQLLLDKWALTQQDGDRRVLFGHVVFRSRIQALVLPGVRVVDLSQKPAEMDEEEALGRAKTWI